LVYAVDIVLYRTLRRMIMPDHVSPESDAEIDG